MYSDIFVHIAVLIYSNFPLIAAIAIALVLLNGQRQRMVKNRRNRQIARASDYRVNSTWDKYGNTL